MITRTKQFILGTDSHLADYAEGNILNQKDSAKFLGMGNITFMSMRNPKSSNYDSTFPTPYKFGNILGYYKKDLESWTQDKYKASAHLQFFLFNNTKSLENDSIVASKELNNNLSEEDFIIAQLLEMNNTLYELSLLIDPNTFNVHYKARNYDSRNVEVPEVADIVGQFRATKSQLVIRTKMIERIESLMKNSKDKYEALEELKK